MDCIFPSGEKGAECQRCGERLRRAYETPPARNCQGTPTTLDEVHEWTKRQYLNVKRALGLMPTCGCNTRYARARERLNRLSRWLAKRRG